MKPFDSSLRNASVVLAGCACLVPLLSRIFYPYSWLPVPGARLASMLVVPLLCLWCGMLLYYRVGGKARIWIQVLFCLIAAYMIYLSRQTVNAPGMDGLAASYLFAFSLGVALPWGHLHENGDHLGVKSAVLCVLTTVIYTALYCFFGAWFRRPSCIALNISWESAILIRVLVQPVFVYLVVVLWRPASKLFKELRHDSPSWKVIFTI